MEDINVKCCRCRNTHLHSARKESAPDRYGMRTLVCPRCGAKEFSCHVSGLSEQLRRMDYPTPPKINDLPPGD